MTSVPRLNLHSTDRWLVLTRMAWIGFLVLQAVVFVVGLIVWFRESQLVCTEVAQICRNRGALTPIQVQDLHALGWSLPGYAWYIVMLQAMKKLLGVIVGVVIFWRRPDDRIAWVASLLLIVGLDASVAEVLVSAYPIWSLPAHLLTFVGSVTFALFFYLFPSGRFVPRWTRWTALVYSVVVFFSSFFPGTLLDWNEHIVSGILGSLFFISFLVAQVYRYRSVSHTTERLQTKWVVLAMVVGLVLFLAALASIIAGKVSLEHIGWYDFVLALGFNAPEYLLPIAIGVAILRYRLFDIDVIIRRTLIYSTLTLMLGLIYLGCILLSRALVAPLTGSSELAIVVSTLVIAALFLPLRRRIQAIIDKRFYRRKYDAAKVLAAFSVTARDETDLDTLTAELVRVVDTTVQPEFVGLWLRETPAHSTPKPTSPESTQTDQIMIT
jgi:hypothetical protein